MMAHHFWTKNGPISLNEDLFGKTITIMLVYFLASLFYFEENVDIASYTDDNTPYCTSHDIQTTINTLQDLSAKLFDWFSKNSMKANADKCHLLLSENIKHVARINHIQIENDTSEKLLGVTIDSDLKFDIHVNNLCKCSCSDFRIYGCK